MTQCAGFLASHARIESPPGLGISSDFCIVLACPVRLCRSRWKRSLGLSLIYALDMSRSFLLFFFVWSARSEEHLSISVESFPVDRAKIRGISSSCLIVRRTVSGLRNGSTMGIVLRVFVGLHCFPCIDRQTNSPPSCRSFIYLSCPISTSDSWTLFQKRCV